MLRTLLSILLGLIIGIALGLYLGWVQFPVEYINSPASLLAQQYKDEYTVMIARGFQADRDSLGAIQRLNVLGVDNVPDYVQRTAERFITNSREIQSIRHLIALSEGLGRTSPLFDQYRAVEVPGSSQP